VAAVDDAPVRALANVSTHCPPLQALRAQTGAEQGRRGKGSGDAGMSDDAVFFLILAIGIVVLCGAFVWGLLFTHNPYD
jgi:hypothetical protein